jgi:hypothetical protein
MVFGHIVGEHGFDIAHHTLIFGVGLVAGLSYAAYKVFSRGK